MEGFEGFESLDAPLQRQVDPHDAKLFVRFYKKSVYDKAASEGYIGADGKEVKGAGRPIFKMADYVTIAAPGDQWNITDREVLPGDKERFPLHWSAFLNDKSQETASGTPLSVLTQLVPPVLNQAQVDEFKHVRINTVEQLADLSDGVASKFMGAQGLKQSAKKYLEATKGGDGKLGKVLADLDKKDNEISTLKEQMRQLMEAQAAQQAKKEARAAK